MRFQCQKCNAILELDDCIPGELVECDKCGEAVAVPETPTSPRALLGEFVIKRELGAGGMGTVYLAHQITLERDVALKVLMPELAADSEFISSFINEARAAAAINHPNIVQAYAVKCDGTIWYFAMEYIDGPTVKQLLEEQGKLTVEQTMSIATEITSALRYAWNERKIIHRDIKPDNIMINSTGHAKLADLGLARKCTTSATDDGTELFGTAQYVAPELLLSEPADPRSDIYSLGASLYQMLTGHFPYEGDTADEIVMKHLQTPLIPIRQWNDAVPEPFAALVENMLVKRPAQRYQSYDELTADLDRVRVGNMPSKELPQTAQLPISLESENPLEIPEANFETPQPDTPTTAGGVKKIKIGAKSNQITLNSSNIAREDNEIAEIEAGGKGAILAHEQRKTMKVVLPIVAVIVVLAAVGAVLVTRRSADKSPSEAPETENLAAETNQETQDKTTQENKDKATQENKDVPSIDKLKKYVADGNPQATFDEMIELLKQNAAPKDEIFTIVSPMVERILKEERQRKFDDDDDEWKKMVSQLQEEHKKSKEEEAAKREAERKKEEEKKLAEQKRKREEERANAIKEDKIQRIDKLHEYVRQTKMSSAIWDFTRRFDDEDADLQKWRNSWKKIIENASKLAEALTRYHVEAPSNIEIPVFVFYKDRTRIDNEIEKYSVVSMKLISFDGEKAVFEAKNEDILQKFPQLSHRRKYMLEKDNTTSFSIDYHLLLPEQLLALSKAVLASQKDIDESAIPTMVASLMVIQGNFLSDVFDNELFEDFRASTDFIDTLKAEQSFNKNPELASQYLQMLEEMLESCQKEPKTLRTRILMTTIRRYLMSLLKSFPDSADKFKAFVEKYQKFERDY